MHSKIIFVLCFPLLSSSCLIPLTRELKSPSGNSVNTINRQCRELEKSFGQKAKRIIEALEQQQELCFAVTRLLQHLGKPEFSVLLNAVFTFL